MALISNKPGDFLETSLPYHDFEFVWILLLNWLIYDNDDDDEEERVWCLMTPWRCNQTLLIEMKYKTTLNVLAKSSHLFDLICLCRMVTLQQSGTQNG